MKKGGGGREKQKENRRKKWRRERRGCLSRHTGSTTPLQKVKKEGQAANKPSTQKQITGSIKGRELTVKNIKNQVIYQNIDN